MFVRIFLLRVTPSRPSVRYGKAKMVGRVAATLHKPRPTIGTAGTTKKSGVVTQKQKLQHAQVPEPVSRFAALHSSMR